MPYIGLPLGILAIVFSYLQKKIYPNGFATAGLVTGIVGIVINAIMGLILIFALALVSALS
jgi:hypothetical protein